MKNKIDPAELSANKQMLMSERPVVSRTGHIWSRRPNGRLRVQYDCSYDPSFQGNGVNPRGQAKQESQDECDINVLMERYERTGILPETMERNPHWLDLSTAETFHEAMNIVTQATETFEALPAKVRDRFGNSPEKFLAFFEDPANAEEMVKLGLASVVEPKKPTETEALTAEVKNNTEAIKASLKTKHAPRSGASNDE